MDLNFISNEDIITLEEKFTDVKLLWSSSLEVKIIKYSLIS